MADPLSVDGLAISVVSLGLQVTRGIADYIDALNSHDENIASVRQQNDSLRKTFQVVETSLSQLQRDHQAATATVRECLDSCKKELQVLESLVAELVVDDQSTTCRKNKIKIQGKRLLYPFSRPKLEQLGTRLRYINATLQLTLQTLGLSVSQLGTEKLATLEATSYTISTGLLSVRSEVSAMNTPLQGIHSTLSGFETRFDSLESLLKQLLVQSPVINGTPPAIVMTSSEFERLPRQVEPTARPLLDLLECLLVNKAPANDYDISGDTPLSHMFGSLDYGCVTDPLPAAAAELILRSNAEDNVACLSTPYPPAYSTILDRSGRQVYAEGTAKTLCSPLPDDADDRIAWIHELHAAALPANIADPCRCKCSPGGCTPLTSLLKGAVNTIGFKRELERFREDTVADDTDFPEESIAEDIGSPEDSVVQDSDWSVDSIAGVAGALSWLITGFTEYLMLFGGNLKVRHHTAALRYLTFTALGIRHSCCHPYYVKMFKDEVEDGQAYELALLEELLCEFEGELIAILQDADRGIPDLTGFWKRTWVRRMREVLDHLEGSDLTDDERRRAEEIGVVWDKVGPKPPRAIGNPYRRNTLDHWLYELEKVEAECQ
ncbi:hypothetical protein DL765_009565 [Monosporascus sp. GIB2]|nr:hypothetical protein DL765_009565 [Monosporascus sp. GIB2]